MNKKQLRISIMLLGLLGLIAIKAMKQNAHQMPIAQSQTIEWLTTSRKIDDFKLLSSHGQLSKDTLRAQWSIILFGYLSCSDICPTSMFELTQLAKALDEQIPSQTMRYIFVSIDPARDSVDQVANYAKYFHSGFIGATGSDEYLNSLSKSLGIRFSTFGHSGNYQIAHSLAYSIIDNSGQLRGRFWPGFDAKIAAKQIADKMTYSIGR